MNDDANDDLYVGYLPAAPPRVARFVRRVVPALVIAAAAVAALLAVLQAPFDPGTFEFGTTRAVEGTLLERPYPMLVERGGARAALCWCARESTARRPTPWGSTAAGSDSKRRASRARSGACSSWCPARSSRPAPAAEVSSSSARRLLGHVEVTGEIVDSKCFLGVMKPGKGKPHRSCAARCLAGGIPPQLLVVSAEGASRLLLLADGQGGPLAAESFLDLVGEPVIASGTVERRAGLLVLRLDDALRRVHRP